MARKNASDLFQSSIWVVREDENICLAGAEIVAVHIALVREFRLQQFFETQEFIEATQRRNRPLQSQLESHGWRVSDFFCWVETAQVPICEIGKLSFRACGPRNFMKEVERNDSSFAAPSRLFSRRAAIAP